MPPAWLPGQVIGEAQNGPRYPGRTSSGALLNYYLYASRTDNSGTRLSAWNELRLFGPAGQFSRNGVWQQQLEGSNRNQDEGYIRYDSWWSNENENAAISWRVGDLVTDSLAWSNSVRLGGIRIGRDFSVRPDLVTYPLPVSSLCSIPIIRQNYVGWDGIVWVENLTASNPMLVVTPDGRRCDTELRIAGGQPQALKTYGTLTCALPAPAAGTAAPPADAFTSGNRP